MVAVPGEAPPGPGAGRLPDPEARRALAESVVDALDPVPDRPPSGRRLPGALTALLDPRFRAFLRAGRVAGRQYATTVGVDRATAQAAVEALRLQLMTLRDPDEEPVGVGALVVAADALLGVELTGDTDDPDLARVVRAWDRATDAMERYRHLRSEEAAQRTLAAHAAHRDAWRRWFAARGVDPSR